MRPDSFFLHTSRYFLHTLTSLRPDVSAIILAWAQTKRYLQLSAKQEITLVMAGVFQFAKWQWIQKLNKLSICSDNRTHDLSKVQALKIQWQNLSVSNKLQEHT